MIRGPAARTGHAAPVSHLAFGLRSYQLRRLRGRVAGHARQATRGTIRDVLSVLSESSAFWLTASTLSPGSPSPWRLTRLHPRARRTFPLGSRHVEQVRAPLGTYRSVARGLTMRGEPEVSQTKQTGRRRKTNVAGAAHRRRLPSEWGKAETGPTPDPSPSPGPGPGWTST